MSLHRYRGGYGDVFPPAVKNLILINVGVFFAEALLGLGWAPYLGLVPAHFWRGSFWQPVTYMFLHGGLMHLFFNMFILWMFGRTLEAYWGPKRFLTYYFVCGVGAGLINALVTSSSSIPTVGASGAIYGLLLAFGLTFPNQMIYIYFLFPIRAKYFVIIIGVIELLLAFSQPQSPIARFAHLGGMIFGYVYLKWKDWLLAARRRTHKKQQDDNLKVVWDRRKEMDKLHKEVDALLDKINRDGIESLSRKERERLKEASRRLREWDDQGWIH